MKNMSSVFSLTLDCSKVFVRHEIVTNTFYKLFHLGNQVMPKNKLFLKKTNNFKTLEIFVRPVNPGCVRIATIGKKAYEGPYFGRNFHFPMKVINFGGE